MDFITLRTAEQTAIFNTAKGMNLMSFRNRSIEALDLSTERLFDQRAAGLGALIGPHFHHRKPERIIPIKDPDLFPHFCLLREKGIKEPFSHGIARYVPWKVEALNDHEVFASLSSEMQWQGIPLGALEGQEFEFALYARLTEAGLSIDYSVKSNLPAVVGLHYYYGLHKFGVNTVEAEVQKEYDDQGTWHPIPDTFGYQYPHLSFNLAEECDYGFLPHPPRTPTTRILLKRIDYTISIRYECSTQDHSWQLYHPEGTSYACIEPLSARNPREPKYLVNGINVLISIENKKAAV